jgi:multicomponent Na+:H+ antiporter subunit D
VVAAAGEDHRAPVFLLLTLASAGTFLHTGLKLPYYMFFGKDSARASGAARPESHSSSAPSLHQGGEASSSRPAREAPRNMLVAMGLAAIACVAIGVFPGLLYRLLPHPVDYAPYTLAHVTSTLGLLGFTALGFFLLLKQLDPERTVSLDTDWFYRRGAALLLAVARGPLARLERGFVGEIYEFVLRRPVLGVASLLRKVDGVVVDPALVGIGHSTRRVSQALKTAVTGHAQHYGLIMAAGLVALLLVAMLAR